MVQNPLHGVERNPPSHRSSSPSWIHYMELKVGSYRTSNTVVDPLRIHYMELKATLKRSRRRVLEGANPLHGVERVEEVECPEISIKNPLHGVESFIRYHLYEIILVLRESITWSWKWYSSTSSPLKASYYRESITWSWKVAVEDCPDVRGVGLESITWSWKLGNWA